LEGQTDPVYFASLCHGKVKAEQEDIIMALEGNLTEHHKFMIRIIRQDIRQTETLIKELDMEIEKQLLPYAQEIALLQQIPGIGEQTAGELISEIGVDMDVFATDKHISSWAGVSSGNKESAGKKSGKTTHGNKQVKSILTESGWAASRTKGTFLSSKYKRLVGREAKREQLHMPS